MTAIHSTLRSALYLLVPFGVLLLLVGWQTDWGRAWQRLPAATAAIVPQPLTVAVLPEYRASVTPDTGRDFIERSLFNPTRRPAPAPVAETVKPRMQRGQFALTGTLVVDGRATALLRETSGGKSRRIVQGETVNGMIVSEVMPDRIRLTLGDESEELALKLAVGPRTTVQPVVAVAPSRLPGGVAGAGGAANAPQIRDVGEVLAERRRAAREAEAAASANRAPGGVPMVAAPPPPAAPAAAAAPVDPQWQSVFQRYQQPRR